jgi:hypothetical protein
LGIEGGLLADAAGTKDMPSIKIIRNDEIRKYFSLIVIVSPWNFHVTDENLF